MPEEKDILEVVVEMAIGFRRLGLKPPEAIVVNDVEDGIKIMGMLHQKNHMVFPLTNDRLEGWAQPRHHSDGTVDMEVKIFDVRLRWPARTHMGPDGKKIYI